MHKAAEGRQLETYKFLSQTFAERVYERDSDGYTMLHWAAQMDRCEVARYLIEEREMDRQDRDEVCVWGGGWNGRCVRSTGSVCANCSM